MSTRAPQQEQASGRTQLAVEGGTPVRRAPFAPWPHYEEAEIERAAALLRSGKLNYWTGEETRNFEKEFAAFTGTKHAIALANGTLALELALRALRIGPGDEVVVTPRSFIASVSCVISVGATPIFADVDRDSGLLTAATIEKVLTSKTRAVIPVHLSGWPCDMDAILALGKARGLHVVEDCAQAHGATWNGRPVGSFGVINAFSFCQDKIITTAGEGGMVTTQDPALWDWAWSYKDHGKGWKTVYEKKHPQGYRWLHESFGTNWRLTEVQSVLGRSMLARLPEMVAQRRKNAAVLIKGLGAIPALRVPQAPPGHSFYKLHVYLRPERLRAGWTRTRIQEAIIAEGVPCFHGSCGEIYREKAFDAAFRPASPLPVAKELDETSLMFLVHPTLDAADMGDTVHAVAKVMESASA